jgi:hypothetical protein
MLHIFGVYAIWMWCTVFSGKFPNCLFCRTRSFIFDMYVDQPLNLGSSGSGQSLTPFPTSVFQLDIILSLKLAVTPVLWNVAVRRFCSYNHMKWSSFVRSVWIHYEMLLHSDTFSSTSEVPCDVSEHAVASRRCCGSQLNVERKVGDGRNVMLSFFV